MVRLYDASLDHNEHIKRPNSKEMRLTDAFEEGRVCLGGLQFLPS